MEAKYSVSVLEKVNRPNPVAECKCILENDVGSTKKVSNLIQRKKMVLVWTQSRY